MLTTDAVGGVWRYSLDLANGLAERGIRTVLAVMGPDAEGAKRKEALAVPGLWLIQSGLPLDWTAGSAAELASACASLRELSRLTGVSSVHLHAPALAGDEGWPVPVVAACHSCVATWWQAVRGGGMPPDFQWRTDMAATGLHTANALIAPSLAHAAAVQRAYGPVTIQVVHNGRAAPTSTPGERARSVLTAGRLWDEAKNAAALDRAAPHLGWPILAAGPVKGPEGNLITLANLHCLGELEPHEIEKHFESATVFASMARYEPFGLAVLEAAQAGMRLVLSDIPTFRELWDGAARFVSDEADLVPALRSALEAEGDGGAQARSARYSLDAMVESTVAVHRAAGAPV